MTLAASRNGRLVVLAAALAMTALTARLGWWQLDRAAQKTAIAEAMRRNAQLPPLPATQLATTPDEAQAQRWRRVTLRGRWLAASTRFLDNRQMQGRVGFFVVTALALADGDAVLVQRGFAPRNALDRSALPDVPTPAGDVEVAGLVAPPPARLLELAREASGPIRQNLDVAEESLALGRRLRPLSVWQQDDATNPGDGLLRHWTLPAADVDRHYGYAFQWFALGALTAGLYVWFGILRPRLRRTC